MPLGRYSGLQRLPTLGNDSLSELDRKVQSSREIRSSRKNEFKIVWNSRVLVSWASHLWRVLLTAGFWKQLWRQSKTHRLLLEMLGEKKNTTMQKQDWADGEVNVGARPTKPQSLPLFFSSPPPPCSWPLGGSGVLTAHQLSPNYPPRSLHPCFTQSQGKH